MIHGQISEHELDNFVNKELYPDFQENHSLPISNGFYTVGQFFGPLGGLAATLLSEAEANQKQIFQNEKVRILLAKSYEELLQERIAKFATPQLKEEWQKEEKAEFINLLKSHGKSWCWFSWLTADGQMEFDQWKKQHTLKMDMQLREIEWKMAEESFYKTYWHYRPSSWNVWENARERFKTKWQSEHAFLNKYKLQQEKIEVQEQPVQLLTNAAKLDTERKKKVQPLVSSLGKDEPRYALRSQMKKVG